jgi:plasmid stabilization system protein ParE
MGYKVVITTRANEDLRQVVTFLAAQNPSAAERLGLRLLDMAQSLADMPHHGIRVRDRGNVRRVPCGKWHAIYYRIIEATQVIEVIRYWDGRRNPATLDLS